MRTYEATSPRYRVPTGKFFAEILALNFHANLETYRNVLAIGFNEFEIPPLILNGAILEIEQTIFSYSGDKMPSL